MISFEYPILISSITTEVRYSPQSVQVDYRTDGNVWEITNWRRLIENNDVLQKVKPNSLQPP